MYLTNDPNMTRRLGKTNISEIFRFGTHGFGGPNPFPGKPHHLAGVSLLVVVFHHGLGLGIPLPNFKQLRVWQYWIYDSYLISRDIVSGMNSEQCQHHLQHHTLQGRPACHCKHNQPFLTGLLLHVGHTAGIFV